MVPLSFRICDPPRNPQSAFSTHPVATGSDDGQPLTVALAASILSESENRANLAFNFSILTFLFQYRLTLHFLLLGLLFFLNKKMIAIVFSFCIITHHRAWSGRVGRQDEVE
jgi:hypothetical protein